MTSAASSGDINAFPGALIPPNTRVRIALGTTRVVNIPHLQYSDTSHSCLQMASIVHEHWIQKQQLEQALQLLERIDNKRFHRDDMGRTSL
nr:hypothetical protein Iba_chr08cCG13220 [Ipomoea batatas]